MLGRLKLFPDFDLSFCVLIQLDCSGADFEKVVVVQALATKTKTHTRDHKSLLDLATASSANCVNSL